MAISTTSSTKSKSKKSTSQEDSLLTEQENSAKPAKIARQRDIAVSEFFAKNRHLLGFDSPQKSLLTAVREAVDNALDACEEARILPEITVELTEINETRYRLRVEDNGPGIPKNELGKIFAKLLYGSKFHRLKQSRGQQGIGISAAVMYSQMTTGEPSTVVSKLPGQKAQRIRLTIDTATNNPEIHESDVDTSASWAAKKSGTSIEMTMQATFKGGRHSVDAYLRQTAMANPHAMIRWRLNRQNGKPAENMLLPRVVNVLPVEPQEMNPHPHGVELGTLQRMLSTAGKLSIGQFLVERFSRVTQKIATDVCAQAGVSYPAMASQLSRQQSEILFNKLIAQPLQGPPTSCLSPIGEEALRKGLFALFGDQERWNEDDDAESLELPSKKTTALTVTDQSQTQDSTLAVAHNAATTAEDIAETKVEIFRDEDGSESIMKGDDLFVTAVTRPPTVYRGNPFQVECGILYSKSLAGDELAKVYRFANRVPLLYQASACAMFKSVLSTPWKSYEVQQSKGALPTGPIVIFVHIASAWVPYTSESKEAIAHYPEVIKELRLALMVAGRRLQKFLRRRKRELDEAKKKDYITKYLTPIGEALRDILQLSSSQTDQTMNDLRIVLEKSRTNEDKPNQRTVSKKSVSVPNDTTLPTPSKKTKDKKDEKESSSVPSTKIAKTVSIAKETPLLKQLKKAEQISLPMDDFKTLEKPAIKKTKKPTISVKRKTTQSKINSKNKKSTDKKFISPKSRPKSSKKTSLPKKNDP